MNASPEQDVTYGIGLARHQLVTAARLYDQAFGAKFAVAIRSRADRLTLFEKTLSIEYALTASIGQQLVGLAGLHTPHGSLTSGINAQALFAHLGLVRGLRALVVFSLYERTLQSGQLLMDGIAVDEACRGRGIGSRLLHEVLDYARHHGYDTVRLDVIDTNPGAKRLYEREGFVCVRREKFPYLRWLLGFGGSTMMERRLGVSRPG